MFTYSLLELIFIIICLFGSHWLAATQDWTSSKNECKKKIATIDSLEKFLAFTADLDSLAEDRQQQIAETINKCIHSVDGFGDIRALKEIVQQLPTVHSVCEPDFINQLLHYDKQMLDNGTRGRTLKMRLSHRLSRFFHLLTGQVIVTCKTNLEKKLEEAEQLNEEDLLHSLSVIDEKVARQVSINELPIDKNLRLMVKLLKRGSWLTLLPENLIVAESIKRDNPASRLPELFVTLNNRQMLDQFIEIKRACKAIDRYARGSIHGISTLALKGYLARDKSKVLDNKLKSSLRVTRWLNSIQYCQTIFLLKAQLDIEGEEIPNGLQQELLNDEGSEWYQFKDVETIDKFDDDVQCFTTPKSGIRGWLYRRLGKIESEFSRRVLSKMLDTSHQKVRNSLFSDADTETDVQFGAASGMLISNHLATATTTTAHHTASLYPVWADKLMIAFYAICLGILAFIIIFCISMAIAEDEW